MNANSVPTLYDREDHTKRLFDAFIRSISQPSIDRTVVSIIGPSGAGKTALALQLKHRVTQDGGYFVSGKFGQLSGNLLTIREHHGPYNEALSDLCSQIADAGDERVASFKAALKLGLSEVELGILQESISSLGKIIETTQQVSDEVDATLPGRVLTRGLDAEELFVDILCKFAFVAASHRPLVIFLDDIHWGHANALKVFRSLAGRNRHATSCQLMILCAYRDDSVSECIPLTTVLDEISGNGTDLVTIDVVSISNEALNRMISDRLGVGLNQSKSLSDIIHYKTNGNVLFASLLFNVLMYYKLLRKDGKGQWYWDDSQIIQEVDAQSLLQFIIQIIDHLPPNAKEVCKVASCLGPAFTEEMLWSAGSMKKSEIASSLLLLEDIGLVIRRTTPGGVSFAHDKMQEAAYSFIPESDRSSFHLGVGQRLLHWLPGDQQDDHLMLVVNQISHGVDLVSDIEERVEYADLYLRAGQKAATSSEFAASVMLLRNGIKLLGSRRWIDHYAISLRLHNTLAEIEYYSGNLDQVDVLVNLIIRKSRTVNDALIAHFTKIYSMGARGELDAALDEGLSVLDKLGERFPLTPGGFRRFEASLRCQAMLRSHSDSDITSLRLMVDNSKLAAVRILIVINSFAYYTRRDLVPIFTFRLIEMTIKHGVHGMSCVGFAVLCLINASRGNLEKADRCANLALRILNEFQAKEFEARVANCVYGGFYPTKHRLRESLDPLLSGHRTGLVVGDLHDSLNCALLYAGISLRCGSPLPRLADEIQTFCDQCAKHNVNTVLSVLQAMLQLIHNFMGKSEDPLVLTGEAMNEDEALRASLNRNPVKYVVVLHLKNYLAVYFNELTQSQEALGKLEHLNVRKLCPFAFFHYLSLAALAAARLSRSEMKQRKRALVTLTKLRGLAESCPQNYINKVCLIEAELASSAGNYQEALSKYEQSIELARQESMPHEEGLACESAGLALRECGRLDEAREYFHRARSCYERWGANAKVNQLNALGYT